MLLRFCRVWTSMLSFKKCAVERLDSAAREHNRMLTDTLVSVVGPVDGRALCVLLAAEAADFRR